MSVTFKKVLRKDPFHKDGTGKYYPQLIVWGKSATLESIAVQMKESSSLTLGDIQSVITNFVGAMRRELFNGRSVNIDNFGVFSLSATTEGSEKKDDCQSTKIRSVRINFRASSSIRPQVAATRAEDRRAVQVNCPVAAVRAVAKVAVTKAVTEDWTRIRWDRL